ncbi:probable DNA-directed RNA polymerase III subunit RPC1 [Rhynchosporium agropyri]|uniref:DNA-directed RNA polymerase subunit n=1 Tax=Rhynchosporium agropyri TaxID=914238 RepID=A0A1E1JWY4_9HELO|nr:probable DNA-directed RNA polymerase III subunit RPC1 [Rhynchosporium agropyri]
MQLTSTGGGSIKAQVVDNVPKKFASLKFGIQSNTQIVNQGVLEVSDRILYNMEAGRKPMENGPLDTRLGTSSKTGICNTCGEGLQNCNGHFGHVRLALPAFHIGYLKLTQMFLQNICKDCARVLLTESERRSFLKQLRVPGIDNLKRTQICKKINEQCRKVRTCPYCDAVNGQIRKLAPLRLAHDRYQAYNKSTAAKKIPPPSMVVYHKSFDEAKKNNTELDKHLKKAMDDLNPLRVLNLFKMITPSDCELLGLNPAEGRPEMFIWQFVPAPPICIRPSVAQENASNEDDLTTKLAEIVHVSSMIRAALQRGQPIQTIVEQWDFLQTQIALYVNSDVPGLQDKGNGKAIRGFCQRLKGKQGRFRGNLSGKRVDFSARTVISPDPNLSIEQVAVPILVAKNMTYPERVQAHNMAKLKKVVSNGPMIHPGANQIVKKDSDHKISLKFARRDIEAKNLKIGDVVERHLEDGDIVLFNRQPSLHKLSIMSHYVKVRPWRTFRLNECVCNPYNADFDGDEMNLHVPQTEEARTEAINLMGVKNNLSTPKNGEPIISATQDFITAAYLLSSKENFFDRKTFTMLCMYMVDANTQLDLPPPSIIKPEALWTGKQVFSILMKPNKESIVKVNLDAKCRDYKPVPGQCPDMDINDGWLVVRNSEVMCGRMDKTTVGSGKKDSIFYVILRDFGPDEAVIAMDRLAKISARYLTNMGFSIGISDVYPSQKLTEKKASLIADAYRESDKLIDQFKKGTLEKAAGCDMEESLETKISGVLSKVRQDAGEYCINTLSKWNAPLVMAKSGSKGSNINVAQMVAVVGQQIIGGQRVADGFQDRTLPHFPKNARQPPSKGFVRNSFFTGLRPTEFLFHAISGREGLVDTAVKTAETGYMSRRLMKSLEDLSTQYDDTVRNSSGIVVQFQFGADKLDPVDMEGTAVPVHFVRTWTHSEALTWDNNEPGLLPYQITAECKKLLAPQRDRYKRRGVLGEAMDYDDHTDYGVDEFESARGFLVTITDFVAGLAHRLAKARQMAGLDECEDPPQATSGRRKKIHEPQARIDQMDRVHKVSLKTLQMFVSLCLDKYAKAHVEPGHAVGAVGAQSIGEPGTQMTLKTFHFAGVAGMSITQGVPRIKEIINASKSISTPVITCPLENKYEIEAARVVKGRIEKTYISEVLHFVEDMWSAKNSAICLRINLEALSDMQLGLGLEDISNSIVMNKKLKIRNHDISISGDCLFINVTPDSGGNMGARGGPKKGALDEGYSDILLRVNYLKRALPAIAISGYPDATRAIIQISEPKGGEKATHMVLVEGYGLRACMTTEGVIGTKTTCNGVMEVKDVLGIEAARTTIATEIGAVMGDMGIDPRHMQLLADVMTYKGEVLGITRFGLSKMRDSVLQLASFEKTPDHLFDAAAGMKTDLIEGVSECIIMGQTMSVGTGAFQVVRKLGLKPEDTKMKPTLFEDAWRVDQVERQKIRAVEVAERKRIAAERRANDMPDAMEV